EGFPDAGTIVVARDFPAAQKREVGGQNLDVEEEESAVAEPVHAGGKRHLGRSAHAMEHRFAGEESAHGDAVEPSGEPRFLPDLDAVRPPQAVQLRIRVEDVGRDPGSFPRAIRARPHDVVERLVERDAEIRPEGAAHRTRPWRRRGEREDRAGIGRCPGHEALPDGPGKDARPVGLQHQRRRERSAHRHDVLAPPRLRKAHRDLRRFDRRIRDHCRCCITAPMLNPHLKGLSCFACGTFHDARALRTVCGRCGMPLRVDYALQRFEPAGPPTLWRYRPVLPIDPEGAVTLGEGFTPLLRIDDQVWVKDESRNPTGSFKARGMAVAVSMAKALGARALAAPSAGNAAGALAAYGAAAGLPGTVAMPEDTPRAFVEECRHYGADTHLVSRTIPDAGKWTA